MITSLSVGKGGLGRFGNQMFTIAGCIGIATKSGQPFAFPHWKTYDNALFGSKVDDIQAELINPLPELPAGLFFNDYGYFWGYRNITLPTGNWNIDAHLQSPKFFNHCIELVRHHFTFKNEPEQNEYVAIHYRAGDYIDNLEAYHPRQPREYYLKAIEHFPNAQFELFTDDIYAFQALDLPIDWVSGSDDKNYIEDFKWMKKCKSFIMANSSFSAMAALLGDHPDKKVIAPKLWFGKQASGLSAEDIYHKDWIVL